MGTEKGRAGGGGGAGSTGRLCTPVLPVDERGAPSRTPRPGLWARTRPGIKGVKASALNRGFNDRSWGRVARLSSRDSPCEVDSPSPAAVP